MASSPFSEDCNLSATAISNNKRKRRPAGTPDPDAEVVSLPPKTLLDSDQYVCSICNQGFQRDQNLQMHRRRHKVPWKLLKRTPQVPSEVLRKKKVVFVCPEPTCLHHNPCHALGDLVGIKKHFRRKHSEVKQWSCDRCSKSYAVQSDFKAHLKTCGTTGHSCDCGRVFSRVETFIEHQDICTISAPTSTNQTTLPAHLTPAHIKSTNTWSWPSNQNHNLLELQLLPPSNSTQVAAINSSTTTQLEAQVKKANEARREAKAHLQLMESEYTNAKRLRQQARDQMAQAQTLQKNIVGHISNTLLQMTCQSCKHRYYTKRIDSPSNHGDGGGILHPHQHWS